MTNHSLPRPASQRRLATVAALSSAAVTALALVVLAIPGLNPYASPAGTGLLAAAVGPTAMAIGTAVLGLLSLVVAITARLSPRSGGVTRSVISTGLGVAVALGVLAQGTGALSLAGYLVALAMPVAYGVVTVFAIGARHWIRIPLIAGAVIGVTALIVLRDAYADTLTFVLTALSGEVISLVFTAVSLGTALVWAALALRAASTSGALNRLISWATGHRVPLTILAAIGAAPYPLVRLSWLTPWAVLAPEGLDLSIRIWGVLLSTGAWLGLVLTLGLILPWGERLPHWFPIGAGRPVHPMAAIVPGALVATMITAAAAPMLTAGFSTGHPVLGIAFLPLWFWGPMLGLAVLGYAGHRSRPDDPWQVARPRRTAPRSGAATTRASTAPATPKTMAS